MILEFPEFSPIDLSVQEDVEKFTCTFDVYSDFTFVNLFCWNVNNEACVSWLNNNLVIKLPDYLSSDKFIYTILGNSKLDASVAVLIQRYQQLHLVPEIVVKGLEFPESYAISEDRDSFDYTYRVDHLAHLKGGKYKKKRNIVNSTREILGTKLNFSTVTKLRPDERKEILEVFEKWKQKAKQSQQQSRFEEIAINRLLDNFESFDLYVTLCRIDGKLYGFSVHEIINETTGVCHFEKSLNSEYPGLGTVLINEAAKSLLDKSTVVNWEQDLGLSGLKKAKSSYVPESFQRKYWISKGITG